MTMDMLIAHKVAPFSGRTPNSQQIALGTAATSNICSYGFVIAETKVDLLSGMISMSVDNPWVVEQVRDFNPSDTWTRSMGWKQVTNRFREGRHAKPVEITRAVFDIGVSLTVLECLTQIGAQDDEVYGAVVSWLRRNGFMGSVSSAGTEVNPGKIVPQIIAAAFVYQEFSRTSNSALQRHAILRGTKGGSVRAAAIAQRLESQWEEVFPILPELSLRKTMDQEIIDLLLVSGTTALCEGEL
jgi:hypothetical protein